MSSRGLKSFARDSYVLTVKLAFNILLPFYKLYFKLKGNQKKPKKTLIIINDHIGDTVVRVGYLKEYIKYFGEENVYFLVSKVNEQILRMLSSNIIVYDSRKYLFDIKYKMEFLHLLNKHGFSNVISVVPNSRHQSDEIINLILGDTKVFENSDNGECSYVLDYLTKMFNSVTVLSYDTNYFSPDLRSYVEGTDISKFNLPKSYIVLGMGADSFQRMYPAEKFSKVLQYLEERNITAVLLGKGNKDDAFLSDLEKHHKLASNKFINLVNKTSMKESLAVIKNADLFLGVESGLWNCAYCLHTPSIVLYGGGHYGRFMHQSEDIIYLYNSMDCFKCNWQCKYDKSGSRSVRCVEEISPQKIIQAIEQMEKHLQKSLNGEIN